MTNAEFDNFARNYHEQVEHEFRKIVDPSENYFIELKAKILNKLILHANPSPDRQLKILEIGSGLGDYFKYIKDGKRDIHGLDLSFEMIKYAKLNNSFANIYHIQADGNFIPYANLSFDVVFSSCVFHHIEMNHFDQIFKEIKRVCKRRGSFVIFEHNPNNIITQFVVRNTPIDKNATLIKRDLFIQILKQNEFSINEMGYLLFGPKRMDKLLNKYFPAINRFPLGAQYYISSINN